MISLTKIIDNYVSFDNKLIFLFKLVNNSNNTMCSNVFNGLPLQEDVVSSNLYFSCQTSLWVFGVTDHLDDLNNIVVPSTYIFEEEEETFHDDNKIKLSGFLDHFNFFYFYRSFDFYNNNLFYSFKFISFKSLQTEFVNTDLIHFRRHEERERFMHKLMSNENMYEKFNPKRNRYMFYKRLLKTTQPIIYEYLNSFFKIDLQTLMYFMTSILVHKYLIYRKKKKFMSKRLMPRKVYKYFFKKNNIKLLSGLVTRDCSTDTNISLVRDVNTKSKVAIFQRWKKRKSSNYVKYFSLFWVGLLEHFSGTKSAVHIKRNFLLKRKHKKLIKYLYKKYFFFQTYIGKGFFLNEMLFVIFYSFQNKDLLFLKNWLKINLERIYFMKHRKFLYNLKSIISELWKFFCYDLKIQGFLLDVRGKLSVAGNAKKRHYLIKFGRCSYSTKNLKVEYTRHLVRSKTGVLGVTILLTY